MWITCKYSKLGRGALVYGLHLTVKHRHSCHRCHINTSKILQHNIVFPLPLLCQVSNYCLLRSLLKCAATLLQHDTQKCAKKKKKKKSSFHYLSKSIMKLMWVVSAWFMSTGGFRLTLNLKSISSSLFCYYYNYRSTFLQLLYPCTVCNWFYVKC